MATIKGMIQQIIKYADGTETVINYNPDGIVLKNEEVPVAEVAESVAEEIVETLKEISEVSEESKDVSE